MARIACLWVPNLALVAILRARPELRESAVAVADGRSPQSILLAVSPEARAAGVRSGMTAAQARNVSDTIVVVPHAPEAVRAAANALADVAATIGPRIEVTADGTVFLDCEGNAALCASEGELATILAARSERHGLPARLGIGSSKLVASIAAREGGGVRVVARNEEATYLAPLPISLLDPTPDLADVLASWGIRRIGELAALPASAAAHRLGPAGARLLRQARGDDDALLACREPPAIIVEALALEYGIDRLEPLLFVVRRLLDHVTSRLALHGLVCAELEIACELDGASSVARRVTPGAPTADTKVLFVLVRAHLEQHPPGAAIVGMRVAARTTCPRPTQLDLFRANGPSPVALATTIARLAALCGADRVGRPVCVDSHRPGATVLGAFVDPPAARASDSGVSEAGVDRSPPSSHHSRVVLRAFRPPLPLDVFENRGCMTYVRGPGLGGRVVQLAGPWRLCGEWWTPDPYDREYYDVELTDGGLYRVYREGPDRRWLADGMYD